MRKFFKKNKKNSPRCKLLYRKRLQGKDHFDGIQIKLHADRKIDITSLTSGINIYTCQVRQSQTDVCLENVCLSTSVNHRVFKACHDGGGGGGVSVANLTFDLPTAEAA